MFAKVAPQQYTNYFNILPFLDYTQISLKDDGTGKLNLLNVFEEQENLVDPGPKAYVGVGKTFIICHHSSFGSYFLFFLFLVVLHNFLFRFGRLFLRHLSDLYRFVRHPSSRFDTFTSRRFRLP